MKIKKSLMEDKSPLLLNYLSERLVANPEATEYDVLKDIFGSN